MKHLLLKARVLERFRLKARNDKDDKLDSLSLTVSSFPAHRHPGHSRLTDPRIFTVHPADQVTIIQTFFFFASSTFTIVLLSIPKPLQGLRPTRRLYPASRIILHQLEPNCLPARQPCKTARQRVGQVPLRSFRRARFCRRSTLSKLLQGGGQVPPLRHHQRPSARCLVAPERNGGLRTSLGQLPL